MTVKKATGLLRNGASWNRQLLFITFKGTLIKTLLETLWLGTCQKLAGGGGVETEGGSQLFETAEKGGVMKNGLLKGGGSCEYLSVIM